MALYSVVDLCQCLEEPTASSFSVRGVSCHCTAQVAVPALPALYYIQGDSGGICITLGNDSMSDSKQKSSYEHGSDFERLRSYGHFLIPVHALM